MKCIMSSIHTCSQINQPCFQSKVTDFFPVVFLNARNTLRTFYFFIFKFFLYIIMWPRLSISSRILSRFVIPSAPLSGAFKQALKELYRFSCGGCCGERCGAFVTNFLFATTLLVCYKNLQSPFLNLPLPSSSSSSSFSSSSSLAWSRSLPLRPHLLPPALTLDL